MHYGDLGDSESLARVLHAVQPDEIYNLAAQSHVRHLASTCPTYTGEVTGLGTMRLLEAVRTWAPKARFYQASSSELFGKVAETPQRETTPFHPALALRRREAVRVLGHHQLPRGLRHVRGQRHPLQPRVAAARRELRDAQDHPRPPREIALGRREQVVLGNLDAKRDWGFAGDYVEAMWLMLQADEPEDYVIGTGETHSVRELATVAFHEAGIELDWEGTGMHEVGRERGTGKVRVAVDPRYLRPAEVDLLLADPTKAREKLGWKPRVGFAELVRMMVQADLEALDPGRPHRTP